MRELRLTNTVGDLIDSSVSTIKSEISDVVATVGTLDEMMQQSSEKLTTVHAELKAADKELKKQCRVTTEQVERLISHQITTIDSIITGFSTCTQLSTIIRCHLESKIRRLTILTAILSVISIAAIIIAIMR